MFFFGFNVINFVALIKVSRREGKVVRDTIQIINITIYIRLNY
jgi:hypothetical protein